MDMKTFEQAEEIVKRLKKVRVEHEHFTEVSTRFPDEGKIYVTAEKGAVTIADAERKVRIIEAIDAIYKQEIEKLKEQFENL